MNNVSISVYTHNFLRISAKIYSVFFEQRKNDYIDGIYIQLTAQDNEFILFFIIIDRFELSSHYTSEKS